jgi:D-glycero-D-manno-heptose 1,7-bisphosphate phosphatase
MRAAVFLDRDGTIIHDDGYLADASRVRLLPGAADALRALAAERSLVVVSNQSGIARGLIRPAELAAVHARMVEVLAAEGITLAATYYCEHGPDDGCSCRKPLPGMLQTAAREHALDLSRSIMIGDKPSDVAAGVAAGCRASFLFTGDWAPVLAFLQEPQDIPAC